MYCASILQLVVFITVSYDQGKRATCIMHLLAYALHLSIIWRYNVTRLDNSHLIYSFYYYSFLQLLFQQKQYILREIATNLFFAISYSNLVLLIYHFTHYSIGQSLDMTYSKCNDIRDSNTLIYDWSLSFCTINIVQCCIYNIIMAIL